MKWLGTRSHALTLLSLAGSGIGFLSQMVLAHTFGVSVSVDAYFFSLGIPTFVGGILSTAVAYSLTPKLRRRFTSEPEAAASLRLSRAALAAMAGLWVVGAAIVPLQWLSLPGDSPIRQSPGVWWLMAGSWLFASLLVQQSVVASLLTAQDRLSRAAILPLFPPAFSCAFVLLGGNRFGVATMLAGQIVGVIASIVFASDRPSGSGGTAQATMPVKSMLSGFGYATAAMACFTAYPLVDSLLAPRAGSHAMSQMAYAQRLVIGLGTLTVAAPFAILANRFSDLAAHGTHREFRSGIFKALLIGMLAPLALAVVLTFSGETVVALLFARGKFTSDDAANVGTLIQWMTPGMVLMLLTALLFRAGFALTGGGRHLALVGVLWVTVYASLGLLLLSLGVRGLALAYSCTWLLACITAFWCVSRAARAHFGHN